jgi:hypothetical protein
VLAPRDTEHGACSSWWGTDRLAKRFHTFGNKRFEGRQGSWQPVCRQSRNILRETTNLRTAKKKTVRDVKMWKVADVSRRASVRTRGKTDTHTSSFLLLRSASSSLFCLLPIVRLSFSMESNVISFARVSLAMSSLHIFAMVAIFEGRFAHSSAGYQYLPHAIGSIY